MPIIKYIALLAIIFACSSCLQHRELVNFNEGPAFSATPQAIADQHIIRLQPDDLLAISIQSVDPVASAPFNVAGVSAAAASGGAGATISTASPSYLIDVDGRINLPMLGSVQAAGSTTTQLRDTLHRRLDKYLKDAIVNVRLVNFKFTVIGEVNQPGTISMAEERINLLEALGMAGDVATYGNRERVLVIREVAGKREFGYLNLHQRDLFASPYFYLSQNDIVYVEPMKAKVGVTSDESSKFLQFVFPIVTVASILITLFR